MRPLSAVELLKVWEESLSQTPVRRALALLTAASPEITLNTLAELPIGQRDERLMTLREWIFGGRVVGETICPVCHERLELDFHLHDIRVNTETLSADALSFKQNAHAIQFRVPNSLDLLALENSKQDIDGRKQILLERCVISAMQRGKPRRIDQLPLEVTSTIALKMAEADPQADVQLSLSCMSCQNRWESTFDILTFFWSEIHAWALRIMQEVHVLASAYGWREVDILELSPWRRKMYLEMVGTR